MEESETIDKEEESSDLNTEDDLPQKILEKYSSDLQVQLIKGYRILQVLMYYLNNTPFFEKPINEKRAGKLYYDVIKNPMWFNEIKRKIFNAEYSSLVEVIKDMRLVFENCYHFWGPKTSISEQCVRMERLMEKQLMLLPKELKNLCSLEETHGKNEDEVVTKIWNRYRTKAKNCSNLMLRTWRRRRIIENELYKEMSDLGRYCNFKNEIEKWEEDVLLLSSHSDIISRCVELPQIGHFLHLVQNILNLEPCCQIEIERMFLMPQYSSSFLRISTSLLTDVPPETPLTYEDLIKKMTDQVNEWYLMHEKKHCEDVQHTSNLIGIKPEFFKIVGSSNPLLKEAYEDLSYHKKVVIVKSLCDYLVHKRLAVKELMITVDENEFFAEIIGRDKMGYIYLFFNSFLDFKLYKLKLIEDETVSDKAHAHAIEDEKKRISSCFFPEESTNFEMVAESVEGLRCLIDELIYSDIETSKKDMKQTNYEIIESLRELENRIIDKEDEFIKQTNQVRLKIFSEWKSSHSKNNRNFVEDSLSSCRIEQGTVLNQHKSSKVATVDTKQVCNNNEINAGNFHDENDINHELHQAENENDEFILETDAVDFLVKAEVKEELQTDNSLPSENVTAGSRRRRSSVASYNVFNKKLFFSDESDSESPEEIYTEGDDSDDDWNVPKKKSKKSRNKLTKQLKLNAVDESKRKKGNTKRSESGIKIRSSSDMRSEHEIKEESSFIYNGGDENRQKEEKTKSALKIKVVDLAKLKNSGAADASNRGIVECAPLPRIVSQGTLRISQETIVNTSSPITANANVLSNVRPTFAFVGQPQLISNAYIIATNQAPFQTTPTSHYQIQQFNSPTYRTQGVASTRALYNHNPGPNAINSNEGYINQSTTNSKLMCVNKNTPIRFSSAVPSKQIVKPVPNVINKSQRFSPNQIANVNRNISMSSKSNFSTTALTTKLGRNITVIPKTNEKKNLFKEIEGTIGIHSNNGTLHYVVNLANGTHVPLSNEQVQKLRDGNNGALPLKLKIPVPADVAEKIEPCVVIDD